MNFGAYRSIRRKIVTFLWARPSIYRWIGIFRDRGDVTDTAYDIVFDGFPRSGNTFGALMLAALQQDKIKVKFHTHLPPLLINAIRQKKIVCLTIRRPAEAIASWVIFNSAKETLDSVVGHYITFYKVMLPYRSQVLVLPFQFVTGDFQVVLKLINHRFDRHLEIPENLDECKRLAFSRIDDIWRDKSGKIDEWRVARPSVSREAFKTRLLEELASPAYESRMKQCEELYQKFYGEFQAEWNKFTDSSCQQAIASTAT